MKNKGITLIALVVTIIVLLVLAGVTLNLVAGSDGILGKATKAIDENEKASIQEELELEISRLKMGYYENKEALSAEYPTVADYVKAKLKEFEFSNGSKVEYDETKDQFSFEIGGAEATFGIDESGKVTNLTFPENVSGGSSKPKDTIAPAVSIQSTTTNSITFYATDAIGVVAYAVTETNEEPNEWEEIAETQEFEKTITGLTNNKTYYIWVKDKAENVSEPQEAVTINFESFAHEISWAGATATITVTAPSTGVKYRIGSTGNFDNYSVPISVQSGTTVQFMITDGTNSTTATSVTPRLKSTISYDSNGGTGSVPGNTTYSHEDNVTVSFASKPTRTGYTFGGWSQTQSASSAEYTENGSKTFKMPAKSVTLYAIWMPNSGTAYKVLHRQMNVDGNGYTTKETENLTGTTGTSVTPAVKSYTGFTAPSTQTTTIAADGSTTITYNYTRKKYTFTLGTCEGVDTTGSSPSGQYYFGATITLKASVSSGYTWDKWTGSTSSFTTSTANKTVTMPAGSLVITPSCYKMYSYTFDVSGSRLNAQIKVSQSEINFKLILDTNLKYIGIGLTEGQGRITWSEIL